MTIHHETTIHSSVENVYKALTNSEQFSELTETTSEIMLSQVVNFHALMA